MWLLILEGLAIGCLLGLTGAGGGILAVPALMTSQGWTVAQAAPIGLLAITFSSAVGMLQGLMQKIVRYRAALWLALMSIPFSHLGVSLSHILSSAWLTAGFSIVMFIVAYRIFFNHVHDVANPPCKVNKNTGRLIWNIQTAVILGGLGMVAGLLTGLLGVGGGFVIVPALRKFTDLNMRSIVATSLMIIFLISAVSMGMHVLEGYDYPFSITFGFVVACVVGMLMGRVISRWISTFWVQRIFAILVTGAAAYLLWSTL